MATRMRLTSVPRVVPALLALAVVCALVPGRAGAAVSRAVVYPVPGPPVVLVTGLDDSTPGMSPGGNCGAVGSMATLCAALVGHGYQVYVASSSSGGGAVIDNHSAFDPNARSLAHYLSSVVKTPALLVGHSMGGIFARIAISRYGAPAAGLFTIASPHDGSFGADLIVGAASFPCVDPICLALKAVAGRVIGQLGSAAVDDLTHAARTADNRTLGAPGVPSWTYAGTACQGPSFLSSYLFPNDGIVGESSAFGTDANLGSTSRSTSSAYHESTLQSVLGHLCGSAGIELGDGTVINGVLGAAACVQTSGCHTAADAAAVDASAGSPRRHRGVRITLTLLAGHGRTAPTGTAVSAGPSAGLIAATPFSVTCHGQQVPAMPALSGALFGIAPGALNCARPTVTSPSSAPLKLAVLSDPGRVVARLASRGSSLRITLAAAGRLRAVRLVRHGRSVRGVHLRRSGARRVTLTVPVTRASRATITATVGGRRYAAMIPPLRFL